MRFAPCVGPTTNMFGNPWTWMPCSDCIPSAQCSRQLLAVTPDRVEAGPPGVLRADLEARCVDQAVEFVVLAVGPHAGLVDALHPLAIGVDQVGARLVVGVEVLVVEAGPLAQLAVPGLERLGGLRDRSTSASTRARISVIFSSSESS